MPIEETRGRTLRSLIVSVGTFCESEVGLETVEWGIVALLLTVAAAGTWYNFGPAVLAAFVNVLAGLNL